MGYVGRYNGCSALQDSGAALSKNSMFMGGGGGGGGGETYIQLILCKVCASIANYWMRQIEATCLYKVAIT